jgi:hypothetical protein
VEGCEQVSASFSVKWDDGSNNSHPVDFVVRLNETSKGFGKVVQCRLQSMNVSDF